MTTQDKTVVASDWLPAAYPPQKDDVYQTSPDQDPAPGAPPGFRKCVKGIWYSRANTPAQAATCDVISNAAPKFWRYLSAEQRATLSRGEPSHQTTKPADVMQPRDSTRIRAMGKGDVVVLPWPDKPHEAVSKFVSTRRRCRYMQQETNWVLRVRAIPDGIKVERVE